MILVDKMSGKLFVINNGTSFFVNNTIDEILLHRTTSEIFFRINVKFIFLVNNLCVTTILKLQSLCIR